MRADRVPKPIAPNPWRRGRRRTGVHNANGAQPAVAIAIAEPGPAPAPGSPGQVIGLFADRASAELARRALADRGYREDAIRLLISDVAVGSDPSSFDGKHANGTLADALADSGVSNERVAEYVDAIRNGAVLLRVITRSSDDARLIGIEWSRSYRAEKVHS